MKIQRSTWIALGLVTAACASAQVSSVNGVRINARVWNDFSSSAFTSTNSFPSSVVMNDHITDFNQGNFANRHMWFLSNDGGTSAFNWMGGNDTFEMTYMARLDSNFAVPFGPRKAEAGPLNQFPITEGWISDSQMIITTDGEVAAFGTPIPFYSFSNRIADPQRYTPGTTVRVGYRYFRDTDNLMKWVWIYDQVESPALTLENIANVWNFAQNGFHTYTWESVPRFNRLGTYLQVMPKNGVPSETNIGLTANSISIVQMGVKGTVTLSDVVAPFGEPVTVEVMSGSTVMQSMNTQLDANGMFSFRSTVPAGTYSVLVKGATHLRKRMDNVVFTANGASGINLVLINGDVDGDNEVGGSDLSLLSSAFLSSTGDGNFNASADLDRDGEVGSNDLSILSANFLTSGD